MKRVKKEQKESKLNQWWDTFKLLWADTRYRAMIKMGMYIIFVGGVLIFIQVTSIMNQNSHETVYKTPLEQLAEKTDYQYQIKLEELNTEMFIQEVNGIRDSVTNKFTVVGNPTSYMIQDNLYYISNETDAVLTSNPLLFDITRLTPNILTEIMKSGEEIANTTYKSGIKEITYEVPLNTFIKYYTGTESTFTETIICKIQVENQKITKIDVDWTNYRKIIQPTTISSNLTLVFQ